MRGAIHLRGHVQEREVLAVAEVPGEVGDVVAQGAHEKGHFLPSLLVGWHRVMTVLQYAGPSTFKGMSVAGLARLGIDPSKSPVREAAASAQNAADFEVLEHSSQTGQHGISVRQIL